MKLCQTKIINISSLLLFSLVLCVHVNAQTTVKPTKLSKHLDVVELLSNVQTAASSIQSYTKDWEGNDLTELKKLYLKLQLSDADLLSRYTVIIKNYRRAKKDKMSIEKEMTSLEKANNEFVAYFNDHLKDHPSKPGAAIWGDLIKIIFDTGKQIYDFVNGINEATKENYLTDLKDKSIPNWGEKNIEKNSAPGKTRVDSTGSKQDSTAKRKDQKN